MSNIVYWDDSCDLTYNQKNSIKWPDPKPNIVKERRKCNYSFVLLYIMLQIFAFTIDLLFIRLLCIFIDNLTILFLSSF